MFGLGKPEDEERMRDRNSINGVKMGGVCEGLYAAKRCNNYGYEESYSSYNNTLISRYKSSSFMYRFPSCFES